MLFTIVLIIALVLAICFSFVLLNGAPYLPTLKKQIDVAFEIAGLEAGDSIIELGCGDGRVLIAAAKAGLNGIGYELNPIMFAISWLRLRPYRDHIKLIWGDFWRKDWPEADAIYVFLLPRLMAKLEGAVLSRDKAPKVLISFAFEIPNRKPDRQKEGVFLYRLK